MRERIGDEYFNWLFELVYEGRYTAPGPYSKLLTHLHDTEFRYSIPNDQNRAEDGVDLRWRFVCDKDCRSRYPYLAGPCSMLEMLVALAIRCEESIMDEAHMGDRTAQWFWGMIVNLGLGPMVDYHYDAKEVDQCINRFLNREYSPDGRGGLFTIRGCDRDLRTVEIWYQLCWYLDSIV